MSREPKLLGLNPGILAGLKDFYESTMADTNVFSKIDGRMSVFNAAVRGLRRHKVVEEKRMENADGVWECQKVEPHNYLLNMGLEQVLAFLTNFEIKKDLLDFYADKGLSHEFLDWAKEHPKLDLTVYAIPEGIPIFANEPSISVLGDFERSQFPEALIIGTLEYETAVATYASYVINILEEFGKLNVVTLEGGCRRVFPGTALAATRAILAAGFKGTSLEQIAIEYPELTARVGGSSGHSSILHIGSDEAAFDMQVRSYYRINTGDSEAVIREKIRNTKGIGPTLLIDTFDSTKGLEAALKVMKRYGIQSQVRNDSGDPIERAKYIAETFQDNGLNQARIMLSDDLKPWKIYDLLSKGANFDTILMGTYLVNPYKLPGTVFKIAMDEKEKGSGNFEPLCKIVRNNPEKGTLPGLLQVYRILGSDGKADRDLILMQDEKIDDYMKKEDTGSILLTQKVMEKGKLIYNVPDMCQIMETTKYHMSLIREENKRFKDAVPYRVIVSDKIKKTRLDFSKKFDEGSL